MKEFEKWYTELPMREDAEDFTLDTQMKYKKGWQAALKWVLELCPTNEKATFANQGQGMDGYTELANYKAMYEKLKEELES